jgi:hypothetical protein
MMTGALAPVTTEIVKVSRANACRLAGRRNWPQGLGTKVGAAAELLDVGIEPQIKLPLR